MTARGPACLTADAPGGSDMATLFSHRRRARVLWLVVATVQLPEIVATLEQEPSGSVHSFGE
jgi:hypothetical protein